MKPNLWIYSSEETINDTAISMILLGTKIFNDAKIIKDLNLLENINDGLDDMTLELPDKNLQEFMSTYLIDCVKILIFFENYMKAELMINGFCVHNIKGENLEFKNLSKRQRKEPISLNLINSIEAFEVNIETKEIFHSAIKETTLGISEIINSDNYSTYYRFDSDILSFLKEIVTYRNRLHFNSSVSFTISKEKIEKLKMIKYFVRNLIENELKVRNTP